MKRILWPLLLVLALWGCAAPVQEETTAPPETRPVYTEPTEPAGIYLPFSDLEAQTDGAVRYYLPEENCYGIRMMGNDVLAFCGTEIEYASVIRNLNINYGHSGLLNCVVNYNSCAFSP